MRVRCVFRDKERIRPWIPEDEDEEDDEGDEYEEGWYEVEEVEVVEGSETFVFMHAQLDIDMDVPMLTTRYFTSRVGKHSRRRK